MGLIYSVSQSSLKTHNDCKYLNLQVVHMSLGAHWGPRRSTMAQPTCHLYVIHIVAPVPHWGPRTLKMARCTWHWYSVAPGLTGDAECPEMARSTYGSSSGSYGSLGTPTAWEWLDVHDGDIQWLPELTGDPEYPYKCSFACGSYSGSCGSLGPQNAQK